MGKMPALAMVIMMALAAGSATPLLLKAQNGGNAAAVGTGIGAQAAPADDMPHRTAKAFAPFIRAIVTRRINTATQIFKLRRPAEAALETPDAVRILARFQKPDRLELNLIGGRTLGQNIGILYFTIATEDGPVAFKINYYGFGEDMYVARMEITDDWEQIEQASATMETLPAPITVPLSGQIGGDGGGQ